MTLSVLYVHHTGVFGGASRSLLELLRAFPEEAVIPKLVTQKGKVPEVFRIHGCEVIEAVGISQLDHTRFGYYRGVRWLILLREITYAPFTLLAMLKARRQWQEIDLVHVNEITNAVALICAFRLFRVPVVVHVRSVQEESCGRIRRRFVEWLLAGCGAVIAIDETVRASLPASLPVHVVHNGFRLSSHVLAARDKRDFSSEPMRILFVGGLVTMKGIVELVHAAARCMNSGMNVKFIIVGDTPRSSQGFKASILKVLGFSDDIKGYCRSFITEHGLDQIIEFTGFTLEIESVYRDADILCFPSHLNAVGRPVIEAALVGVPSIVAIRDAKADTIVDHETGLCIPEKDEAALFTALRYCYDNPAEIKRMGENARRLAEMNFDINRNAEKVLSIYGSLLPEKSSE